MDAEAFHGNRRRLEEIQIGKRSRRDLHPLGLARWHKKERTRNSPELRNTTRVKRIQMDWPEGMRPHIGPHVGPPRPPSYQECVNLPQANVAQPRRAAMTQVDQPMSPEWMYSPEANLPPSPDMLAQSLDLAAQRSPMETDQPSQALVVHPEANRENPDENPLR